MAAEYGGCSPSRLDRLVIATTRRLPNNWLGLRLAIALRRIVTMRLHGRGLDVERWGLRMRLFPGDNGCEKNLLFTPQMYEVTERAALDAELRRVHAAGRPFVFVDIGANVGLFSLFVAAQAGDARIVAIEPEPGNVERLRFNIAANPKLPISVRSIALGAEAGQAQVTLDKRDRGGTTTQWLSPGERAQMQSVPCLPLLDVLNAERIATIDALKIDTEGVEDQILAPFFRDAPESQWPRMIIIEDAPLRWRMDLLRLMRERGYALATRSKQNLILRRSAP